MEVILVGSEILAGAGMEGALLEWENEWLRKWDEKEENLKRPQRGIWIWVCSFW